MNKNLTIKINRNSLFLVQFLVPKNSQSLMLRVVKLGPVKEW